MKSPITVLLLLLVVFPCLMVAGGKRPSDEDSKYQTRRSQRKEECPDPPSDVTCIKLKPQAGGAESISHLPCSESSNSGSAVTDGQPKPEVLERNGNETDLLAADSPGVQGNEPPARKDHEPEEEAAGSHTDQHGHETFQPNGQKLNASTPVETPTSSIEATSTTLPITTQEPTTVTTEDPNWCRRNGFSKPWPECNQESRQNDSQEIAEGLTSFSLEIFNQILQKSSEPNVVFSPMSVALALSHLLLGARGKTKELLLKNLFYLQDDNSSNCVHSMLGKMIDSQGFQSASGMFYRKDLTMNEFFLNQSKEFYKITPQPFTDSMSKNLEMVNNWVEQHTNGKIKKILDELDEDTRLVLANAIFYMGKWINKFNPKETKNGTFWGTEKKIKMMHSNKYPLVSVYDANLKARVARFPLSDDMSMLILLPQLPSQNALSELGNALGSYQDIFQEVLLKLDRSFVAPTMVSLPRFKVDSTLDLLDVFSGSPLGQLFSASNLCGMSDSEELMVSGGRHRAVLKMDEAGVTAAAATAVSLGRTAHVFEADHPYIFIVWSERGKLPVMMGRITDPSI